MQFLTLIIQWKLCDGHRVKTVSPSPRNRREIDSRVSSAGESDYKTLRATRRSPASLLSVSYSADDTRAPFSMYGRSFRYNWRFAVQPVEAADLHRILCLKTTRVVQGDWSVAHHGQLCQLETNVRGHASWWWKAGRMGRCGSPTTVSRFVTTRLRRGWSR